MGKCKIKKAYPCQGTSTSSWHLFWNP